MEHPPLLPAECPRPVQARAISSRTWQTAELLDFLLYEIDFVNTGIQGSLVLTTTFNGRIEAVKNALKSFLPVTNPVRTIPAVLGAKSVTGSINGPSSLGTVAML